VSATGRDDALENDQTKNLGTRMKRMNRIDEGLVGDTVLTEAIIGAGFAVSNTLGCGFLEKVYENALAIELRRHGFDVKQQVPMEVRYREEIVGLYQADLVVQNAVVVELKAARDIDPTHRAQCLNYLRASGLSIGLVMNFGRTRLDVQRVQSFH
jgi:GxxExxY protein